jgi:hypothetical protein
MIRREGVKLLYDKKGRNETMMMREGMNYDMKKGRFETIILEGKYEGREGMKL